eukprot:2446663-Amphidinium_carterae.1
MDQQAKLAQAATEKREELREELVTVYLALEKLPAESLPLPKLAAQVPGDGTEVKAPPPPALLALLAYTKQRAQDGDQEAQTIYEQVELAQDLDQLDQELAGTGEPANELQSNGEDASMLDASEEPPEQEHDRGEEAAVDGDADARTRIRLALEQGVDPLGPSGGALGSEAAEILGKYLVKPKSKAKSQPSSQF